MGNQETQIISEIISKTDSALILFFIILLVVLVVFFIPLYTIMSKDRKERRRAEAERVAAELQASNDRQDKYIQREAQIIKVITANTEVMAGLKATLENDGVANRSTLERVHDRIDDSAEGIARIEKTQDQMAGNQKTMQEGINTLLLLVDSLPHTSNFGSKGDN